jgi:tetratricopeptide (TPR) repeat protein
VLTRGGVALQEGRYTVAEAHYEEALESATVAARSATASERREIAAITGSLGVAKQFSGDREGAALQFRRQLEVVSDLGDPVTAISPLSNLGNVLRILGRHDEAKAALEEGLRLAVDEHYDTILPALNINLGVLHRQLGESTVARRHFEAAAKLARERGRLPLEVLASFQLGRLELESGTVAAAREHGGAH